MKTFGITRKTAQTAVVVGRPAAPGPGRRVPP